MGDCGGCCCCCKDGKTQSRLLARLRGVALCSDRRTMGDVVAVVALFSIVIVVDVLLLVVVVAVVSLEVVAVELELI